jgi:hypothetical protein
VCGLEVRTGGGKNASSWRLIKGIAGSGLGTFDYRATYPRRYHLATEASHSEHGELSTVMTIQ